MRFRSLLLVCAAVAAVILAQASPIRGDIISFSQWTRIQDPADPNFTSTMMATEVHLLASDGAVPSGVDIGYQSVDGATAATST